MILIVFPLVQENPFPVKLKKGDIAEFSGDIHFLVTGMGRAGGDILKSALSSRKDIKKIIEFGGAASVKGGLVGCHYEITEIYSLDGGLVKKIKPVTELGNAAITGGNFIFNDKSQVSAVPELKIPLLFSMETLFFADIADSCGVDFASIRLVTDDGTGDIRRKYLDMLEAKRKESARIFLKLFKDVLSR